MIDIAHKCTTDREDSGHHLARTVFSRLLPPGEKVAPDVFSLDSVPLFEPETLSSRIFGRILNVVD